MVNADRLVLGCCRAFSYFRSEAPETFKSIESVSSFRYLLALSVIPLQRARGLSTTATPTWFATPCAGLIARGPRIPRANIADLVSSTSTTLDVWTRTAERYPCTMAGSLRHQRDRGAGQPQGTASAKTAWPLVMSQEDIIRHVGAIDVPTIVIGC